MNAAVDSLPARFTLASPIPPRPEQAGKTALALPGRGAPVGASFQSAVDPVPAVDTEAGAVVALAVEAASRVASRILTTVTRPALLANTSGVLTPTATEMRQKHFRFVIRSLYYVPSVVSAVQVAEPRRAVVSDPTVFADALSFLKVEVTVAGAVR